MQLGIDASNIRAGGGLVHLAELLSAARPQEAGWDRVTIWGGTSTLARIEDRPWLCKTHIPALDKGLPARVLWQQFSLDRLAGQKECDALFVPGGTYSGNFRPFVTMSQNLLPFEWAELRRFGVSWTTLRLMLLRRSQARTFQTADGVIFLTNYARDVVMREVTTLAGKQVVIPHGVDSRFKLPPRSQKELGAYSTEQPIRILYVSIVNLYKHQWHVAEAVARLREEGIPVQLDLIGASYPPALKRLNRTLSQLNGSNSFIRFQGKVPHAEIVDRYHNADIFVFASTCETFGQILTEAMASGLPIACSGISSMHETLGSAGVYFNPEDPQEIYESLRRLIHSPDLRRQIAHEAYENSQSYTWERCAGETFQFIAEVAERKTV